MKLAVQVVNRDCIYFKSGAENEILFPKFEPIQ